MPEGQRELLRHAANRQPVKQPTLLDTLPSRQRTQLNRMSQHPEKKDITR